MLNHNNPQTDEEVELLGMERAIRRAFESATSPVPQITKRWHEAEIQAARRRVE